MMSEAGYSLRSANITLIDACRRAGLGTAGSGYKIWPTQQAFRDDLMRHALAMEGARAEVAERLREAMVNLGPDPDLASVIRVSSIENVEAVVGTAWFNRLIALWLAAATDDAMRDQQVTTQRRFLESLRDPFLTVLATYGREPRPPFTADMLTMAIAAEMVGVGYYAAHDDDPEVFWVDRSTGPEGETERWHLIGCVVEAIVEAFTRPIVDTDPTA